MMFRPLILPFGDLAEHVVQRDARLRFDHRLALLALALVEDLFHQLILLDRDDRIARVRHFFQAEDGDRHRRARRLDRPALVVDHRADAAGRRARNDAVARVQRAVLDEDGRDRALALIQLRLDDRAARHLVGVRLQFAHFGDEIDGFEQVLDALARLGGNGADDGVAAPLFGHEAVVGEALFDALDVRLRFIHLVDGDDDGNVRRLRVVDRLDGLRHDAVVRRDDEHDDIRDGRAARAHGGERLMARRVEEGDRLAAHGDGVGADVLGDAARLARRDVGAADLVEQRRLAVVDVAHDRDDGRTDDGRAVMPRLAL